MSTEQARIEASLGGVPEVESGARKMGDALDKAGAKGEKSVGGALKSIKSGLGSIIQTGLTAAGVLGGLNVLRAVEDVRHLDEQTARLQQTAGIAADKMRTGFDQVEKRTLQSSMAMADFALGLGRASYNAKGAVDNVTGLSDVALALGQTLGEQQDFGATMLGGMGASDAAAEFERIRAQAAALGETGKDTAVRLKDLFSGLGGVLGNVATGTDEARAKLEALVLTSTKGLKPDQAKSVSAGMLGFLKGKAMDIQRATGVDILDEYGQLRNDKAMDPIKALALYKNLADKKFGKGNSAAKQRAIIYEAGQDVGRAIIRTDPEVAARLAQKEGEGTTAAEADEARKTAAAKRRQTELAKDQARRGIGGAALAVQDKLVETVGVPGATALELGGGALLAKGASLGGKALVGALGAGGAAAVGAVGGTVLGTGVLLSQLGQDRDEMGKEWRGGQKATIGKELAQQAVAAGEITSDIYQRAKRDDAVVELLQALNERMGQLNDGLRTQVAAGIAAEIRKAPLVVREARGANDGGKRGNP